MNESSCEVAGSSSLEEMDDGAQVSSRTSNEYGKRYRVDGWT